MQNEFVALIAELTKHCLIIKKEKLMSTENKLTRALNKDVSCKQLQSVNLEENRVEEQLAGGRPRPRFLSEAPRDKVFLKRIFDGVQSLLDCFFTEIVWQIAVRWHFKCSHLVTTSGH